jgi:putative spermidine/putrescine transport system permease protein
MNKRAIYLLLPGLLFLAAFMLVPITLTIASTFVQDGKLTLEGYLHFFRDGYFNRILLTTLRVSVVTTLVCMLLGYPAAYYISRTSARKKSLLLALSIFPLYDYPRQKRAD